MIKKLDGKMASNKMPSSISSQETRRSKPSHGNLRLCVITWNVANKEIFDINVKNLIDHAFCVSPQVFSQLFVVIYKQAHLV